jgi:hypothetical protein
VGSKAAAELTELFGNTMVKASDENLDMLRKICSRKDIVSRAP